MATVKATPTTAVQKNITARHRASCGLSEGKKRCTCSPAYLVKVGVGPRTKQRRITRTFRDIAEAQRWLLEHSYTSGSAGDVSIASLLMRFSQGLEGGKARDKHGKVYKRSTAQEYIGSVGLLLVEYPEVLRRPVDTIFRSDLQQMIDGLAESRSPQRVRNMLNPLRVVLSEAARDGLIRSNPATDLRLPAKTKPRPRVVDFESDEALVDRLQAPLQVLYGLALYAGLRRGEIMGLRWGNLDMTNRIISAEEAFTYGEFTSPKSEAGRRQIPMPSKLVVLLRDWYAERSKEGSEWVDALALVLAGGTSPKRPIAATTIRRMAQNQGAPQKVHDLRHSYGTMLARSTFE